MKKTLLAIAGVCSLLTATLMLIGFSSISIGFGYASFVILFALGVVLLLWIFEATKPARFRIAIFIAVSLALAYQPLVKSTTDSELAAFVHSGVQCNHFQRLLFSVGSSKLIIDTAEEVCYMKFLKKDLESLPPEEAITHLLQAANLFRSQDHFSANVLIYLEALLVLESAKEKRNAFSKEARIQVSEKLFRNLVSLLELYPYRPQLTTKLEESVERIALIRVFKSIENTSKKLETERAERSPADTQPIVAPVLKSDPDADLKSRLNKLKTSWGITDAELAAVPAH